MQLSIILCVRNEIKTIKKIIGLVKDFKLPENFSKQILIVDNCSTDGTREFLKTIENEFQIIYQKKNLGKGYSIKTALRFCTGDFVIPQDCDLEYSPDDIYNLITHATKHGLDFTIGSRRNENTKKFHKYWLNEFGANALTYIFNIFFSTNFSDVASCYKLMNTQKLKKFNLRCNGFDLDYEMAAKFIKNTNKYGEIKIAYNSRSYKEGRNYTIFFHGIKALFVIIKEKIIK